MLVIPATAPPKRWLPAKAPTEVPLGPAVAIWPIAVAGSALVPAASEADPQARSRLPTADPDPPELSTQVSAIDAVLTIVQPSTASAIMPAPRLALLGGQQARQHLIRSEIASMAPDICVLCSKARADPDRAANQDIVQTELSFPHIWPNAKVETNCGAHINRSVELEALLVFDHCFWWDCCRNASQVMHAILQHTTENQLPYDSIARPQPNG
jgi:hypothetical protein